MTDPTSGPMGPALPPLRRRPGVLTRVGRRLSAGVRRVEAQREPYAEHWDRTNARALESDGPLWVALGDSTAQGIGASHPDRGYVGVVAERLGTGRPTGPDVDATEVRWRLLNLSFTGARIRDVVDRQLGVLDDLTVRVDLCTCVVGTNDLLTVGSTSALLGDIERLAAALPSDSLVGRLGTGPRRRAAATANDRLDQLAEGGSIRLFDPWRWPDWTGTLAEDRFHPNDRGHRHLADRLWSALTHHGDH